MNKQRLISLLYFNLAILTFFMSPKGLMANEIDTDVVSWQQENVTVGEKNDLIFSVNVGVNENGVPIKLKYSLHNISTTTIVGYFPNENGITNYLQVNSGTTIIKGTESSGSFESSYSLNTLAPDKEITWNVDMTQIVPITSDFYTCDSLGPPRISTLVVLLHAPEGVNTDSYSEFTRTKARVVWLGSQKP